MLAITAAVTALGVRLGMPHSGFVAGHALASVLLLACAVALLLTRRVLRGTARVHVSIGLASVAVLKLVLFDATALSGLFLVGGSSHPGGGLPLVMLSVGLSIQLRLPRHELKPLAVGLATLIRRAWFTKAERDSGIAVVDVTDPTGAEIVGYAKNRDFSGDPEAGTAGDLGP